MTVTVSFVGSSVDAAAFVRSMTSCTVESTAALRAPSRAAFAVLFHEWNANPKSMIAEDQHEEERGDDGELDRRRSALAVDPAAPVAGMREPRAAVERVRGSLEHWACAVSSFIGP